MFFCVCFLFISSLQAQKKYLVVLDAGHGGKDPGASKYGYIEKKIALNVVLNAGKILQKNPKIKVAYTRKKDVFVELHKRAKIANKKDADLFVSVHCNANNKSTPHGSETYVLGLRGNSKNMQIVKRENAVISLEDDYKKHYDYDPNSPQSVIGLSVLQEENLDASVAFASFVQGNFAAARRKDRSVHQANFLVLRETVMPSVLIELGFLTNKKEGSYLNSKKGQLTMAKAIAKAVENYIKQMDGNTVSLKKVSPKKKPKPAVKVTSKVKKKVVSVDKSKKVVIKKQTHPTKSKVVKKQEPKKVKVEKKFVKKVDPVKKDKVVVSSGIEFRVQISASKVNIKENSPKFRGLKGVKMLEIDGYYKYFYGKTTDFYRIKDYLLDAKDAGMSGAFVVGFDKGKKIPLREAINKSKSKRK